MLQLDPMLLIIYIFKNMSSSCAFVFHNPPWYGWLETLLKIEVHSRLIYCCDPMRENCIVDWSHGYFSDPNYCNLYDIPNRGLNPLNWFLSEHPSLQNSDPKDGYDVKSFTSFHSVTFSNSSKYLPDLNVNKTEGLTRLKNKEVEEAYKGDSMMRWASSRALRNQKYSPAMLPLIESFL